MKPVTLIGIALIIVGVLALAYQGITYTTREKVIDIGPLKASVDKEKTIPLPPILGALALAVRVLVVVARSKVVRVAVAVGGRLSPGTTRSRTRSKRGGHERDRSHPTWWWSEFYSGWSTTTSDGFQDQDDLNVRVVVVVVICLLRLRGPGSLRDVRFVSALAGRSGACRGRAR